jgi:hypothetical protein
MKNIKILLSLMLLFLLSSPVFAQSFYRPWKSYSPTKPKRPYEKIETQTTELVKRTCVYNDNYYEPNEFFGNKKIDIESEETFKAFKDCCKKHPSRCVSHYIGSNNQTLLYTMVENNAYKYMEWILTDGLIYETNVDEWGVYTRNVKIFVPIRSYNPMMLACIKGDLTSAKILRKNGAYLTKPENARKEIPFQFAKKYRETKPEFFKYIKAEYEEEKENIPLNIKFGETFSLNNGILQDFIDYFEKNFYEKQQKLIEKINEINRA